MKNIWKLQVFLAVAMVTVFFPTLRELYRYTVASDEAYIAGIPLLEEKELIRQMIELQAEMNAVPTDVAQYFRTASKASKLEMQQRKFLTVYPALAPSFMRHFSINIQNDTLQMQDRYVKHFGQEAVHKAAQAQDKTNYSISQRPNVPNQVGEFAMNSYLISAIIAFFFFCVSLKRKKMLISLELHKIFAASLTWPIAVWKYPRDMKPVEQIKKALRLASYFLTAMVSVGGAGLAKAATGEKETEKGEEGSVKQTLVIDTKPKVSFATGYKNQNVNNTGFLAHDGPILWIDAAVSFSSGITVDLWGSRRVHGSSSSDELDLTVSKSFVIPEYSTSLTTGFAYYDIAPVFGKGADFVSPFASIEKKFPSGVQLFARAGGLLLTRESSGKNGYSLRAGISKSTSIGSGVNSDVAVSFVRYAGPFGTAKATSTRYDASLSAPVSKGWTAFATLKAFVPWKGNIRPQASELGMGLAFQF